MSHNKHNAINNKHNVTDSKLENTEIENILIARHSNLKNYLNCLLNVSIAVFCAGFIFPIFTWERKFDTLLANNSCNTVREGTLSFAIYSKSSSEDHLLHVKETFERLGFHRVSLDKNWDVLWAHDYPYYRFPHYKRLQHNQVVNHIPGCGFITNKVHLSTTKLPFLPRAFRIPEDKNEFLDYAKLNQNSLFVEKHNEHRHIVIKNPVEINFQSNNTFIQEYIQRPFLVDGYKFDIGVYVVITSIDPLRVYMYSGDILFRYCSEKYYPFNSSNIDKYVVGDDYLPTWEIPSLKSYFQEFEGGMRNSFEAYLQHKSINGKHIWPTIENIIRETILAKEKQIADILRSYISRNFFELLRFDFILDENLNVYLMEANMSPNLSSAHFRPNSVLYEQLLYSIFNLVSIGSTSADVNKNKLNDIITTDKDLATFVYTCATNGCNQSCNNPKCWLCLSCMTENEIQILQKAHREHLHRTNMKRIFPKLIENRKSFDINEEISNLTSKNKWMSLWFYGKCLDDNSWCQ